MKNKDTNKNWKACERKGGIERVERRRDEASERKDERAGRSAAKQVRELDIRLGKGKGAKRERKKLAGTGS
jgi:hypothetical protein